MRILLIDDDEELMEILASKLVEQHYAVDIANTGEMGWEFILLFNYDLVVLDLMLPDIDGIALCQQIRAESYEMPIMLLTARNCHSDKVRGLDAGADDYVVKPFNFEELTARIRALLRREIHAASPILHWQKLSLDPKTHEVKHQNQLLPLTPKEYALMELLMRHPQQVFSPSAIIDSIWAGEDPPGEEAVRTHIKGLRQKLQAAGMTKDTIKTVYGVGYRLKPLTDTNLKQDRQKTNNSQKIADSWSQFRDVALQRLAILEKLAIALAENKVTQKLQTEAKSSAHKLAGSLGGFGFPQGSKIAKQIENSLENDLCDPSDVKQIRKLIISLSDELQHQPFEEKVKEALGNNISLLIIDHDPPHTPQLATEARIRGITTYTALNFNEAREIIAQQLPTAVVQTIVFPDGKDLIFLEQLHQQMPQLPIVIITEDAQLSDRLEIVRKGGNLILQSPVEPSTVISSVTELIQNQGAAAKVLILDDDPQVLLSLEIGLKPWGFQLTTLESPQQFWQVLEKVEPDLLVLDIEMPEINGIELCQLLRCDRRWQKLPVLFLTVHQDEKTQHQAFAIGADDYICKPVVAGELANRIINRLQRSRFLKSEVTS
ncbi:MAG: response regulator [Xenococcaceae cyanobacterium MO_167.B27]|nr:response regulator [Xenococcaceae cyanobacterium MO_167.B27]